MWCDVGWFREKPTPPLKGGAAARRPLEDPITPRGRIYKTCLSFENQAEKVSKNEQEWAPTLARTTCVSRQILPVDVVKPELESVFKVLPLPCASFRWIVSKMPSTFIIPHMRDFVRWMPPRAPFERLLRILDQYRYPAWFEWPFRVLDPVSLPSFYEALNDEFWTQ
jgi:hypothetical protein